jgi:hypothetical protein
MLDTKIKSYPRYQFPWYFNRLETSRTASASGHTLVISRALETRSMTSVIGLSKKQATRSF